MRKLKLQIQTTVDGYMAGPNGEMDWMKFPWTDDIGVYVAALMETVDCIVLGRNLAEGFIPHWAAQPADEDQTSIDWMNNTPKVVLSTTLAESPWDNAAVASDLTEAIDELKAQQGGDLIAYGGGMLVSSLISAGLVDELHLFVNPTAIGTGMPVFPTDGAYRQLELVGAQPFDCGITAMHFRPKRT